MVVGNTVWLRLQSYSVNVKLLAMVLVYSSGGDREHSLVKVAKLQCKTAGHGPCLYWFWGAGKYSHFWSKTVFSAQTTFMMLIRGPLSYRIGNHADTLKGIGVQIIRCSSGYYCNVNVVFSVVLFHIPTKILYKLPFPHLFINY